MVRAKYTALRWVLVQLQRWASRYNVNFDNAVESSRKAAPARSSPHPEAPE